MEKIPRIEQETIITYEVKSDEWILYTDYPPHIRKYRDKLKVTREEFYRDGTPLSIEGVITGGISVRKKPNLSEEERKSLSDRMKAVRNS